uniref:BAP29/BAP31 transmembrane domain-containing protein n=1 Tax=Alexandrium andersonii TaxID=327968 RepID=A0A7S2INF3_9DINO|mmetsp:Transcript_86252/g.192881  ORF Transcript_86252/g.192881 Transcript_86252/m.192881 type:complete len:124 (+) Transcript_86252:83-454(+)
MLWSLIAYGFAPAGVVLWIFLLSGFRLLEGVAQLVSGLKVAVGKLEVSLPLFVTLLSAVAWVYETFLLMADSSAPSSVPHTDRDLMKRWRQERNWWILNFNLVIWISTWRLSSIFATFRAKED